MVKAFRSLNAYRNDLMTIVGTADHAAFFLRGDYQLKDNDDAMRINMNFASGIKEFSKYSRASALKELKTFLGKPENRENPLYKKAVLAYGTLEPKAAHEYIAGLQNDKNINKDKIKQLNLVTLEKEEGLDLGGRKAFREMRKQKAQQPVKEQAVRKQ